MRYTFILLVIIALLSACSEAQPRLYHYSLKQWNHLTAEQQQQVISNYYANQDKHYGTQPRIIVHQHGNHLDNNLQQRNPIQLRPLMMLKPSNTQQINPTTTQDKTKHNESWLNLN